MAAYARPGAGLFPLARLASVAPPALLDRLAVDRAPEQLHAFVSLAFGQVEPARPFADGKVLHVMCETLEAVSRGEIKRLIVNVPPGFMKSLLFGVFWPAWDWLLHPERRFIWGSYDPGLTLRDARKTYDLLHGKWFIDRFGRVLPRAKQPIGDYYTLQRGSRFSTSVKGKATGRHFDVHGCDDPTKPKDANGGITFSEAALDEVRVWWDETMATRTTDYEALIRLVVMQRLHTSDLSGKCLDRGGYTLLCIPMRYDETVQVPANCNVISDWRTKPGELAWTERFPARAVEIGEKELGSQAAIAAQFQQRPTPKGGLMFRESEFRYWHPFGDAVKGPNGHPCLSTPHPDAGTWFQSWDMAFKDKAGSDYVCGGVWQGLGNILYLRDRTYQQLGFGATCHAVLATCEEHPRARQCLIEDKANGPAVENTIKDEVPGIIMIEPEGGKLARASACDVYFGKGYVVFPHPDIAPWMNDQVDGLIKQLTLFPFVKHDDQVDMVTQAVIWYFGQSNNKLEQAMANLHKVL